MSAKSAKTGKWQLLACCALIACLAWPATLSAQEEVQQVVKLRKIKETQALQKTKELQALQKTKELQALKKLEGQGVIQLRSKEGKVIVVEQAKKEKKGLLGIFSLGRKKPKVAQLKGDKLIVTSGETLTLKQTVDLDDKAVGLLLQDGGKGFLSSVKGKGLSSQSSMVKEGKAIRLRQSAEKSASSRGLTSSWVLVSVDDELTGLKQLIVEQAQGKGGAKGIKVDPLSKAPVVALSQNYRQGKEGVIQLRSKEGKVIVVEQAKKEKKGLLDVIGLGGEKLKVVQIKGDKLIVTSGETLTLKQTVDLDDKAVGLLLQDGGKGFLSSVEGKGLSSQIILSKDGEVKVLKGYGISQVDDKLTELIQGTVVVEQAQGKSGQTVVKVVPVKTPKPTQTPRPMPTPTPRPFAGVLSQNYRQFGEAGNRYTSAFTLFGGATQLTDKDREFLEAEFPLMYEQLSKLEAEQSNSSLILADPFMGIALAQDAAQRKELEQKQKAWQLARVRKELEKQTAGLRVAVEDINREIKLDLRGDLKAEEKLIINEKALEQVLSEVKGKELEIGKLATELAALAQEEALVAIAPPARPWNITWPMDINAARERQRISAFAREMQRLQKDDPEGYEIAKELENLEQESQKLGKEIQQMKEGADGRDEKIKKLQEVLGKAFEAGEKRRQREADAVEDELNELRELMAKRQENREMIIKWRLSELTGQNEVIIW